MNNNEIELEMEKAWLTEAERLEFATIKQAFRIGFLHGRISGSAETGKAMIEAVGEAARLGASK